MAPESSQRDPAAVKELMRVLGGGIVVADACGVSPQSVSNWGADGRIPARHHPALWRLAQRKGVDWQPPGYEGLRLVPDTNEHFRDVSGGASSRDCENSVNVHDAEAA